TYFFDPDLGGWSPKEPVIPVATGFFVQRNVPAAMWVRSFLPSDCPTNIPPVPKDFTVLPDGSVVTNILTESDEDAGVFLRGTIFNAQWITELDWALTDYPLAGGPAEIGGLLYLRNEGSNAIVYMQGLAENGPPLVPPRPNPMPVPESGTMQFLA